MVSHILNMLMMYLNSNESLRLNDTFKLYLTIFSIDHEKFKVTQGRKTKKRTTHFYKNKKVHVGCNERNKLFKRHWAVDFPTSYPQFPNVFLNKCLLLGLILGLLQHSYLENKIENKAYLYALQINSQSKRRQFHAGNTLLSELLAITENCKLDEGPYPLIPTVTALSLKYKVQFFIFTGLALRRTLEYMYPIEYDDTLKPIFLYHSHDSEHLIFIRNINSYFRANYRICFVCKKSFSTANYRHLCPKRECCFACRRFYLSPNTYVNSSLINDFCDRFTTSEHSFECSKCNLTIFSNHCLRGHHRLCYGKGYLGWKCNLCNKFFYRYGEDTSSSIKSNHQCSQAKKCRFCFEPNVSDHICLMKKCLYPKTWPKLGFLSIEFLEEVTDIPFLLIMYIEQLQKPCKFQRLIFSDLPSHLPSDFSETEFFSYLPQNFNVTHEERIRPLKEDFKENLRILNSKNAENSMKIQLLQVVMKNPNVTYLCQDNNSTLLVIINDTLRTI